MAPIRIVFLTFLTMAAFAANSLFCRLALRLGEIGAADFTLLRIASGALTLALLLRLRSGGEAVRRGDWPSALALFAYAAAFSYAYLDLTAATGALLLFGVVQVTMIGYGLHRGERFSRRQWLGFAAACAGLVGLLLPGLTAPPMGGALLMAVAGLAWGIYSLRGRRQGGDPTAVTAGNFLRAVAPALVLAALQRLLAGAVPVSATGVAYALASGVLASGLGYALWYRVLPALQAGSAATVQLSVPPLAAIGGVLLLGEAATPRLILASLAILGGIALVLRKGRG